MLQSLFEVIGYGLCHQLPERSFVSGGLQLPVCARDTGIYLGFVIGLLALRALAGRSRPSELPRWPVLALIGLFVAAMGFDGVTSYAGLRSTTNDLRLVTGMVTGWGMATLTFPMINSQLWASPGPGRVPDGARQVGIWLASLVATFGVTRWLLPLTGIVYPLLATVAIVCTFTSINLVLVGLVPAFERRAGRARDAWLAALLALGLTVAELAAASALRTMAERLVS